MLLTSMLHLKSGTKIKITYTWWEKEREKEREKRKERVRENERVKWERERQIGPKESGGEKGERLIGGEWEEGTDEERQGKRGRDIFEVIESKSLWALDASLIDMIEVI